MVTRAMGKIVDLTVRAEAAVRPLFETYLRCCCRLMALVFEGLRCHSTLLISE